MEVRKIIAVVLLCLIVSVAGAAKSCPGIDPIPRVGLVGEYLPGNYVTRIDAGGNTRLVTWLDSSGNGNNASQTNQAWQPWIATPSIKYGALEYGGSVVCAGDPNFFTTGLIDLGAGNHSMSIVCKVAAPYLHTNLWMSIFQVSLPQYNPYFDGAWTLSYSGTDGHFNSRGFGALNAMSPDLYMPRMPESWGLWGASRNGTTNVTYELCYGGMPVRTFSDSSTLYRYQQVVFGDHITWTSGYGVGQAVKAFWVYNRALSPNELASFRNWVMEGVR